MRRIVLWVALTSAWCAGCGGLSYRYSAGYARPVADLQGTRMLVAGAVDARGGGAPSPQPSRADLDVVRELDDVRAAVHDHVSRAGAVPADLTTRAPASPAEIDQILQLAAQQGYTEVMFVRYHGARYDEACFSSSVLALWFGILPWLIIDSIPFNSHGGTSAFEAIVVDTAQRQVLARSLRAAAYGENVSAWGCGGAGVMHEMMGRAVQAMLEDIGAQRAQGYPGRGQAQDIAALVLSSPVVRVEGSRVTGLGWSFEIPPGWSFAADVPGLAGARAPDGTTLAVTDAAVGGDGGRYYFFAAAMLTRGATITAQWNRDPGRMYTHDIEASWPNGTVTLQRVMSPGGFGVTLTCTAPAAAMPARRAECEAALSSLRIDVVTRQ